MVLSYLTSYASSYVYSTPSTSAGAAAGPQPTRSNSVRKAPRRTAASRQQHQHAGSSNGSTSASTSTRRVRQRTAESKDAATGIATATAKQRPETVPERGEDDLRLDDNGDDDDPALAIIDYLNTTPSFYDVVGVHRDFKSTEELRRAYMARCRVCHPDKFPHYAEDATSAFQRVSLAYQTLSKPSSRRAYDLSGAGACGSGGTMSADGLDSEFGDETLHGVLYTMYCEFLEKGDFEMVRVLVEALNASNPGLNLGDDAIEGIEGALRRLRGILLAGAKHFRIVRFELIKLYEIQHDLRQLSYFDVFGRLRLSLQLARVTLSIPMAIDRAMKEEGDEEEAEREGIDGEGPNGLVEEGYAGADGEEGRIVKRGLLGPRVAGVLGLAVAILEKGERII